MENNLENLRLKLNGVSNSLDSLHESLINYTHRAGEVQLSITGENFTHCFNETKEMIGEDRLLKNGTLNEIFYMLDSIDIKLNTLHTIKTSFDKFIEVVDNIHSGNKGVGIAFTLKNSEGLKGRNSDITSR